MTTNASNAYDHVSEILSDSKDLCAAVRKWETKKNRATFARFFKKEKVAKDPNRPKKNQSAYLIFSNRESKRIRTSGCIVGTDVMKEIGRLWNEVKQDKKQLAKYEKAAVKDKVRYEREMAAYAQ